MKKNTTTTTPADFHVCFPPKSIYSPARANESRHHPHHLTRRRGGGGGGCASPSLWANTKLSSSDAAEPTSPKVTCVGQIKVRATKKKNNKNWQSVMEEIDNKRSTRVNHDTVGSKKDKLRFLTCFHSTPDPDHHANTSTDQEALSDGGGSKAVFSKWYMVMQENKENEVAKEVKKEEKDGIPPSNALLLMRCGGTPAASVLEEKEEEEKSRESLILKCYAPEVASEKWIVNGGLNDPFSRSRRWRRC